MQRSCADGHTELDGNSEVKSACVRKSMNVYVRLCLYCIFECLYVCAVQVPEASPGMVAGSPVLETGGGGVISSGAAQCEPGGFRAAKHTKLQKKWHICPKVLLPCTPALTAVHPTILQMPAQESLMSVYRNSSIRILMEVLLYNLYLLIMLITSLQKGLHKRSFHSHI